MGTDHTEAHSAEADVTATIDVFLAMLEKYPDLPKEMPKLASYSNYEKPILDLDGFFTINDHHQVVFARGKNKDKVASEEKAYLTWMVSKGTFSKGTKLIANQQLHKR